ncbi:3-oxo-tetronate kinase [Sulfitobacter geojensis]|uniref:3-oxo-tetronate kinase n=1 Tax=Sulfitobacter geojensis TaxID=1342299 RepID=A0AAE2VYU4_9RHOB|nr:3-oxo-tetronate kinase [Sulfitobacter geojensis]MBM1689980.1 four-carbon acid sugar kinase family protein [Sulfitobacter geojensis]MBM1694046.1 four-carbon acid sugar kinase family protein [Sulfitobacter geojensis]MBM1706212.1 four-carbon acid sugar kinase family protein [Sulfitobacter geojensis]MBM1710270.1 four-carbon acid sugar kinase family protein [Sulfitobacter geojensis]MBM1714336.1 four-carbon acid sugar kinase family protein [Sulfitobacter geojensis]
MKLGVIADDFTGASDIALTLAEGGMSCVQYVGTPSTPAQPDVEAGVVSLKSRTVSAGDAVAQSLAACDWLTAQGCSQIVFKVCSTFDSTAQGNIGPVAEALADHLGEAQVIVCPAFPESGRSVYQGHLFVGDKLLNASGMQDHPLTPMTDADLRTVLAAQTAWPISHIATDIVFSGGDAIAAAMPRTPAMIIVDAIRDDDLRAIAQAARSRKLLVGGSGIAIGLPANFGAVPATPDWQPTTGAGVVLSGSCSTATRGQVAAYAKVAPSLEITPEDIMAGRINVDETADWALAKDTAPLIYSSADPASVKAAQQKYGRDRLAHAIEGFFTDLTRALAVRGLARLVVAGGETSGAVVAGLGCSAFSVGPRLAAGVPMLKADNHQMAVALKSGNFGAADFFAHALLRMSEL